MTQHLCVLLGEWRIKLKRLFMKERWTSLSISGQRLDCECGAEQTQESISSRTNQVSFLQSILWQVHIASSCPKQIPSKGGVLRQCISQLLLCNTTIKPRCLTVGLQLYHFGVQLISSGLCCQVGSLMHLQLDGDFPRAVLYVFVILLPGPASYPQPVILPAMAEVP